MSACVVDASVVVAAAVDGGPDGAWSEALVLERELVAPELVSVEAMNILRRLESAGRIDRSAANLACRDLLDLDLVLFPFAPFAPRAWELRANLTAYDAWYVAVAEALDLPLATLNRRLAGAVGPRCDFLGPRGSVR